MQYLIIFLLALLNGLFAMAEISIVSSRKIRLQHLAEKGNWRARIALDLANDPHKFLPTVQIGMTTVSIIAGVYGGTELAEPLKIALEKISWLTHYAHAVALVITVTLATFLTLVVGELVPKTIGISQPERIAVFFAPFMIFVMYVTAPFVWLLSRTTQFILRLIRFRKRDDIPVTEEELKHFIEQGREHGVLEERESEMMHSIFRTADRNVNALMTPRRDIVWLDVHASRQEVQQIVEQSAHSTFPVCEESLDHLLGVVAIKDVLLHLTNSNEWSLRPLIQQPLLVPESMPALTLLEEFRKTGKHASIIVNEYGSVEGMITLHDVVEAVFGNIPVQEDAGAEAAVQRADGSWLIDGTLSNDEWSKLLELDDLKEEDVGSYNTLGGFMMQQLGKIPNTADSFVFRNYRFEVVDMDGKRVDKVLANRMNENGNDE